MLVAGVGSGLFAMIFVTVLAFVIALVAAFVKPDKAVLIAIGALCLPLLTFGLIMAAPTEQVSPDSVVFDGQYIPRIILCIVMCLGALIGPGYWAGVLMLGAPPYQAPEVTCRRKKIQQMHPHWSK